MTSPGPLRQILAIDTSTEACSAALSLRDGTVLLRFQLTQRSHADLVLPMVDELLTEASLHLGGLDGLAFGRGPGGFTGLRVAAGVIQGLAYGAGLRVAPVSSLAAVAFQVFQPAGAHATQAGGSVLVCNDARMNEVYWGCFSAGPGGDPADPRLIGQECVSAAEAIVVPPGVTRFAGNAFVREPALGARLAEAGLEFHADVYPRADAIARIGAVMFERGETVAPEAAVPVYVRDNVAQAARRTVTEV